MTMQAHGNANNALCVMVAGKDHTRTQQWHIPVVFVGEQKPCHVRHQPHPKLHLLAAVDGSYRGRRQVKRDDTRLSSDGRVGFWDRCSRAAVVHFNQGAARKGIVLHIGHGAK